MTQHSPTERQALIAELRQLSNLMRSAHMDSSQPFMDLDLTIPQLKVIFLLDGAEPMSMSPLAQRLGITVSACTHLVDKLVRSGWVDRHHDPDDRRVVRCVLTLTGQGLADRLRQSMPFEREDFVDRMSTTELKVIVEAMKITHRVMSEMARESSTNVP